MSLSTYSPFDDILEGCQIVDFNWRYLYLNEAAARQARSTRRHLLGRTMPAVFPGIERTPLFETLTRCMRQREPASLETEFTYPDGSAGWFEVRVHPVPAGLFLLSIDVTARVQAEQTMAQQLARLQSLRTIDLAILGTTDVQVALATVLRETIAEPTVVGAVVLLATSSDAPLRQSGAVGEVADCLPLDVRIGEGAIGRAAVERRPICGDAADVPHEWRGTSARGICAVPLIAKGRIIGVLAAALGSEAPPEPASIDFLDTLGGQAAMAVDSCAAFEELQRANASLAIAYDATLEGWAKALDLRDRETVNHTDRVARLTVELARSAGIAEPELVQIRRGALLHDIGKMGVPDTILLKAGPLTEEEWVIMRLHPVHAYEMLSGIPYLRAALDIPYCHHERWDGSGYPRGLKGVEIPLAARLFAVIDVWDALTSDRPYRPAWPAERALDHIRQLSGSHFDPAAVSLFFEMLSAERLE
jgi:putative nucleotidyltransferase with HDIG domain/PAS domain S-box-containing protein